MTNGDHEGYNDVTDHTCSAASVRLFNFSQSGVREMVLCICFE